MLLMIDNYDSFTYNLVQYFGELGQEVRVVRNDALTVEAIAALQPARIVISPGPCTPNEAGVSLAVLEKLSGIVPILGVCLGHQSLGQAFGGKVVRAKTIMHGKTSRIRHDGVGMFAGIPDGQRATRELRAVDGGIDGRLFHGDIGPLGVQLFGQDDAEAGLDALPDLGVL